MSQAEPSRARRVLKKAFFAGLSLAIIVLATEVVVRVVYAVRWPKSRLERTPIHWTVTGNTKYTAKLAYVKNPWNQHKQIIRNDSLLYWSFKKAVQRRFLDITAPQARRDGPVEKLEVVEVRTNRRGFRGADFYETKTPGTFRIACLGDSYTFGFSVDQEDTYPLRLQGLFNLRFPEKRFEVLNCGVYGYSSHQGLKLLTERVLAFEPDVLILGFGVNDSSTTLRPESDARYDRSFLRRVTYVLDESEAWKIYKFLLIKAAGAVGGAGGQREGKPWEPRVSVGEYAANLQAMIRAARDRGIVPLLICPYPMTFRASPYFMALSGVAAQERVTLIDPWPNLNRKQRALWAGVESALGLAPSDTSVLDEPRGAGPGFEPDGAAFPCVVRVYFGPHEEGPK